MNETALQNKALAVLLALVTIAFFWILLPYYGAIFWAVILGILFAPLQRHLLIRFGRRRTWRPPRPCWCACWWLFCQ